MAISNASQPSQQDVQILIQRLNSGQLAQAETLAKSLIAKHPSVFILHHVLSLACDGQQKFSEAVIGYQNALKLQGKPDASTPDLFFNCAIALTNVNRLDEAIAMYQQAIKIKPSFFEAYGNLGTILYRQLEKKLEY
jgi:cytochrome c-type biogenesis protein CcmH/NrfG